MPPRLTSLSIRNFRGVRNLDLAFEGKNAAILGPNGSGKSSIVDAIDFLLSGQIRRLAGQGTGAYSFTRHAPHIDGTLDTGYVEAQVSSSVDTATYRIRRTLRQPTALSSDRGVTLPADIMEFIERCRDTGLHLLTRREILRFILAEPSRRGQRVAALLQTDGVDSIRIALQGASRDATSRHAELVQVQTAQRVSSLRCVSPAARDFEELLQRLNKNRRTLGAAPLLDLSTQGPLADVTQPHALLTSPLRSAPFRALLADARARVAERSEGLLDECRKYRNSLRDLRADEEAVRALSSFNLISFGLDLISANRCPLCLLDWDAAELRALLQARLEEATGASVKLGELEARRARLKGAMATSLSPVRSLQRELERASVPTLEPVGSYLTAMEALLEHVLPDPKARTVPTEGLVAGILEAVPTTAVLEAIDQLQTQAAAMPLIEGVQAAWDELTRADIALQDLRETVARRRIAKKTAEFLRLADQAFIEARDEVLQRLYDSISDALAKNYRALNPADATQFSARIDPTRAGLNLEVDFHGRGRHPPGALHSEGNQDAMGLCLFLALAKQLNAGPPGILVLDDVVMSVDRGHRRAIAALLTTSFPETQFVVTTHDRVWWQQLRLAGLVSPKKAFVIEGWSLRDGPQIAPDPQSFFADARLALEGGSVPQAAHALRRGIESLGPELCDSLGAQIRFRSAADWSAGEYLNGAVARYGELLRRAKDAAQSWGHDTSAITIRDQARVAVNTRLGGENWAVNVSIHFNEWADLGREDFQPVLSAYSDLLALFTCAACDSLLRLVEEGLTATALRCACSAISINLQRRPRGT